MNNQNQNRPERRLAAILAADVAGYSRLMGIDEADTAKALLEHRAAIAPILARYDGRVVKTTGDGVLGRVDGFDQDECESESHEGTVVLRGFLAS